MGQKITVIVAHLLAIALVIDLLMSMYHNSFNY